MPSGRSAMTEKEDSRTQKLFQLFKTAVEKDREAQTMYSEALLLSTDPSMTRVLQKLYDEEVRHEQQMMAYYKEIRDELGSQE